MKYLSITLVVLFLIWQGLIYTQKTNAEKEFNECLQMTHVNYQNNWNDVCKSRRLRENCSLPTQVANGLEQEKRHQEDLCMKQFEIKK